MLRFVTLLVLLVTTWNQQVASSKCGDKCSSKEHGELYSLLDKTETAINNILQSEDHKKIVQDITKKMKSKICDLDLTANEMSEIIKMSEGFLRQIQDGKITEDFIISLLNNDPMKHIDSFIEILRKKKNNEH
ncbi:hypothetical protein GDO81_004202 [Engystomops pustulosus]|uniref:Uncharacterized protein n=1 Tax=Engystomops pustulosus TaxID=76066 RepID=A0AAV6ZWQ7_ENGPU|nr:hypothetical protein GDO81_004202 [Engystomops pustulosus]